MFPLIIRPNFIRADREDYELCASFSFKWNYRDFSHEISWKNLHFSSCHSYPCNSYLPFTSMLNYRFFSVLWRHMNVSCFLSNNITLLWGVMNEINAKQIFWTSPKDLVPLKSHNSSHYNKAPTFWVSQCQMTRLIGSHIPHKRGHTITNVLVFW